MDAVIECKCTGCDAQGWDSYTIAGDLYIECSSCGCKIEGNFITGEDGWIKQITKEELLKQRAELIQAHQDALNNVPLADDEHYESDAFYTKEIEKLNSILIKEESVKQ
jgi:hypothetical protein